MIGLMKRILTVSGIYKKRILLAFVFSFLKSLLSKAPIMLAFLVLTGFYEGSISARSCLLCGLAMVLCVAFQAIFQAIFPSGMDVIPHFCPNSEISARRAQRNCPPSRAPRPEGPRPSRSVPQSGYCVLPYSSGIPPKRHWCLSHPQAWTSSQE